MLHQLFKEFIKSYNGSGKQLIFDSSLWLSLECVIIQQ